MKKSKLASGLVVTGGALALALAFTLTPSQVAAIPYASLIRVSEQQPLQGFGLDISYTLNEAADSVTLEVYNTATNAVIRTYNYTSPDPETTRGRHTINWDGNNEAAVLVPASSTVYGVRVSVTKTDGSTTWTKLASNGASSSAKPLETKTMFSGYSPNDLIVPQDPTANSYGFVIGAHGFVGSAIGMAFQMSDLQPFAGNGGGANLRMRHPTAVATASVPWWNGAMDPIDPEVIFISGQQNTPHFGAGRALGHGLITDIPALADNASGTGAINPRSIAVKNVGGSRFAFISSGNNILRHTMDATYPHAITGTATTLTGGLAVQYAQDIEFDNAGNLYHLNRSATGGLSELWRWDSAVVDAAGANGLTEANAAWRVRPPADVADLNSVIVDRSTGYAHSGNVYVINGTGANRGVWLFGKTSDATLGSGATPLVLTNDAKIINFTDAAIFGATGFGTSQLGMGVETDRHGNLYIGSRVTEETYSFSPPAKAAVEDPDAVFEIDSPAPPGGRFTIVPSVNVAFVDKTNGSPDNIKTFNSLRQALLSFGPSGVNNGFAGTNRIEISGFGPFDEELPDLTAGFDADPFEIVSTTAPTLVLQRGSTWELGNTTSINGLVIAASSTTTPTGTLVSSTGGTQTFTNSWITALPAAAASYTQASDIPAGIADGTAAYDGSLVRAGNGLTVAGGTVTTTNTIINQHTVGVVASSGAATLNGSQVVSNSGNGITNSGADLTLGAGSRSSNNGAVGIAMSGGTLSTDSTYGNPITVRNNPTAGIQITGGSAYAIRNTLVNNSAVGLDIGASAPGYSFGDYRVTDSIFSNSSTAGIRIANAKGFSMERVTLHANTVGILDSAARNDFWSLELRDTIISGPGGTGIQSSSVGGSDSIYLDYCALVTAGPNALTTANTAVAATFVGGPTVNADPEYRSTTFSSNRLGPDFYLAPSAESYLGAAAPPEENGGSPFQNLGGGSRWTLGPSITTLTVGNAGTQLYPSLADAVDGVNSLGSTGGAVLTILIETNLTETRVSRLGVDTGATGGILIRPKDGLDLTVDWAAAPTLSGTIYSGQLAIGANQGVNNSLILTNNVVIDGKPAGSPSGTALTFSGPGRHINLTGGAKNTVIRNMRLNSTTSAGAVIAVNALNAGGVDFHPDGLIIEDNLIQAASTNGAHVGIVLQAQAGVLTTAQEDLTIRNNRIEYNSSAVFLYPSGFNAEIYGNEFYGRQPVAGLDARAFYFFTSANYAQTPTVTTNIYNNYFDVVSQTSSATNGLALVSFDSGASTNVHTVNFYNNFIATQTNSSVVPGKFQIFLVGGVVRPQLNILHNSVHVRAGSLGIYPTLNTANTGFVQISSINAAGVAKVNARNNLIRVEEPQIAVFNIPTAKIGDLVENYNTVYRVPIDPGTGVVSAKYGRIDATNYPTLAEWQAVASTGANSDEAVIAIDPEANAAAPAFTGVWTAAPDRVTVPATPTLPNYRWTAVPGDSSVWGGVPGLLTNLPGGNADIDGTVRNTGKPYRGAHEAATMPGDNIPPDPEEPDAELGDINEDGTINVADVTELANIITAGQQGTLDLAIADINGDTVINDADVEALADLIVNPAP